MVLVSVNMGRINGLVNPAEGFFFVNMASGSAPAKPVGVLVSVHMESRKHIARNVGDQKYVFMER